MKRKVPDRGTEPLFDLPLDQERVSTTGGADTAAQPQLPLETQEDLAQSDAPAVATAAASDFDEPEESGPVATPFRRRLVGGCADLAIHLAVLGLAVAGSAWLGVPPSRLSLFPLILFGAGFSFIYHVLPLVFWGYTPGMAARNLSARSLDGGPLTMGQAVGRWLGVLLNIVGFGLPFLFLGTRSLSDRLGRSAVNA